LRVSSLDKQIGIEVYLTKSPGIGGKIREEIKDFVVEEVLVDGSRAQVNGDVSGKVLRSSPERQRFLLCLLVKRDWDTLIAIKNVAKQLGIDSARIQIAGIKDAKAWTAQHLTIEGALMEDTAKINLKDVSLFPVGYVREALSSYYLLGNHFTIKIKGITHSQSVVEKRLNLTFSQLEANGGFPNFFGHQRFGSSRPITHLVGKAIFLGKLEEAAMIFLTKASLTEHPSSRQARQNLQKTRDFGQALEGFPRQLRFERLMLACLTEHKTDFAGAFQRLPLKLQELFVQAYQSFLFNRFLSGRLKAGYPLQRAIIGDYVVGVERSGLPFPKVAKVVIAENEEAINQQVKAGRMQVALPLVGARQNLSEGGMGQIEQAVLQSEEAKLEELRWNPLPRFGGGGGLRAVRATVKELRFNVLSGSDNRCEVELNFMLQKGCYATVVLREIMKAANPLTAGF